MLLCVCVFARMAFSVFSNVSTHGNRSWYRSASCQNDVRHNRTITENSHHNSTKAKTKRRRLLVVNPSLNFTMSGHQTLVCNIELLAWCIVKQAAGNWQFSEPLALYYMRSCNVQCIYHTTHKLQSLRQSFPQASAYRKRISKLWAYGRISVACLGWHDWIIQFANFDIRCLIHYTNTPPPNWILNGLGNLFGYSSVMIMFATSTVKRAVVFVGKSTISASKPMN